MVKNTDNKKNNHKMNTRSKKNEKLLDKKKFQDNSDDDEDEYSKEELHKLLYSIFPSKYMKNKIIDEENESEEEEEDYEKSKKSKKKSKKVKNVKNKKSKKTDTDSESDNSSDDDSDEEDEDQDPKITKFDIIFTIKNDEEDDEEYEEDSDYEDDDEDEYTETESEEEESEEEEEEEEEDQEEEEEEDEENEKNHKDKKDKKEHINHEENKEILNNFKNICKAFMEKNKGNPIIKDIEKQTKVIEKKIKKEEEKANKKQKGKNCKKFMNMINNKSVLNDTKFFKDKMNVNDQQKILNELEEVQKLTTINKPYKLKLLEAPIPKRYKACALKKINSLKMMHPGGGEYYKIKNWIDSFLQIPFDDYKNLPVSLSDGEEKCQKFMEDAQNKLNEAIYGMEDAKIQIMQMIGQWMTNPQSIGSSIALKGPMGTGKTTLIKEGVSKILGRDFAFIPLGGATDSSFLEGHSYTYEGSTYGKIVDILIQTKSANPIIYFDELDKVSDTAKGEEIIGILTHLTDISQNTQFHDKYFSEIEFDLSKCLFIFSYNDESRINPILRDRMYVIETKGYDSPEKLIISNNYLIPTVEKLLNFEKDNISFEDGVIEYIIEKFTKGEKGVRNLKRCIEIVFTKLNLYRLMKPGTKLFSQEIISDIKFPFKVTKEHIDKLIKLDSGNKDNVSHMAMYL